MFRYVVAKKYIVRKLMFASNEIKLTVKKYLKSETVQGCFDSIQIGLV